MGRIVDILVDRAGALRAAVIDFGGFFGVGSRKIAVEWHSLHFKRDAKSDKIIADLPQNRSPHGTRLQGRRTRGGDRTAGTSRNARTRRCRQARSRRSRCDDGPGSASPGDNDARAATTPAPHHPAHDARTGHQIAPP